MSKAALLNFTQCAAKDLAPFNVRANILNPGMAYYAMHQRQTHLRLGLALADLGRPREADAELTRAAESAEAQLKQRPGSALSAAALSEVLAARARLRLRPDVRRALEAQP